MLSFTLDEPLITLFDTLEQVKTQEQDQEDLMTKAQTLQDICQGIKEVMEKNRKAADKCAKEVGIDFSSLLFVFSRLSHRMKSSRNRRPS